MNYIVKKDWFPPLFSGLPPVRIGDRIVEKGGALQIIDPDGAVKVEDLSKHHFKRISKKPLGDSIFAAIGGQLKAARERKGMKQTELAALMRTNSAYISSLEAGRIPVSVGQLQVLAGHLGYEIHFKLKLKTNGTTSNHTTEQPGTPVPAGAE